jgi:restriction endonuclease SmaI-like protein
VPEKEGPLPKETADQFRSLREEQRQRVVGLIRALSRPRIITRKADSDFASEDFASRFADVLIAHHSAAKDPFSKEKFENELIGVLSKTGHKAEKVPGQTARDISVDRHGWSLKTQADTGIEETEIHISKFMELGKGQWVTEEDLPGLRDAMLHHMESYDRIFVLRCFIRSSRFSLPDRVKYELVEIPKDLLKKVTTGKFRMVEKSKQNPKPGYCTVTDENGDILFHLYFDGGTERKLQVTHLRMDACVVHATWDLELPA